MICDTEFNKNYIEAQKVISIDDLYSNYSKEDLIEIIGINFIELYLRKKKLEKIKKGI
jgi:hypothetical protein